MISNIVTAISRQMPTSFAARSLIFVIAPLPFIAVYAHKGMAVLAVAATIGCLLDGAVRERIRQIRMTFLLGAVAALLAWAVVSILWAGNKGDALSTGIRLPFMAAEFIILFTAAATIDDDDRRRMLLPVVLSGGALAAIIGFENATGGALIKPLLYADMAGDDHIAKLNPGNAILSLMAFPVIMASIRLLGKAGGLLAIALIVPVLSMASFGMPFFAVFLGLLAAGAAAIWPAPMFQLAAWAPAAWLLAAPVFPRWLYAIKFELMELMQGTSSTLLHRLEMWNFSAARILEKPFLGWGVNSSRSIPGGQAKILGPGTDLLPLHPHNWFIQIWLELGGVGAVVLLAILVSIPFLLKRAPFSASGKAVSLGLLITILVFSQGSFSAWSAWWLATIVLSLTACLAFARPVSGPLLDVPAFNKIHSSSAASKGLIAALIVMLGLGFSFFSLTKTQPWAMAEGVTATLNTSVVFSNSADKATHCGANYQTCLEGIKQDGRNNLAVWLGASQLFAVVGGSKEGKSAPGFLAPELLSRGVNLVTISPPTASIRELYLVFERLLADHRPKVVVLGLFLHDFKWAMIRPQFVSQLTHPSVAESARRTAAGKKMLSQLREGILRTEIKDASSIGATVKPGMSYPWIAFNRRLRWILYSVRKFLFGGNPEDWWVPIHTGEYSANLEAYEAILSRAEEEGVKVVAYIAPRAASARLNYSPAVYSKFIRDIQRISEKHSSSLADLSDAVPVEYWGKIEISPGVRMTGYKYFTEEGHKLLAAAILRTLTESGSLGPVEPR